MAELFRKPEPDADNRYRYGDVLTSDKPPAADQSKEEELYFANYGFDSLISECCTWHYWQFSPQEGISRKGIYKQYTEFELAVTPLSNLLFIYRQKKGWDTIQIEAAKDASDQYTAAVKAASKKARHK